MTKPKAARQARRNKAPRLVINVTCDTSSGWRWLKGNVRGATLTYELDSYGVPYNEMFSVTDEHEWARSLAVAGCTEGKS